MNDSRNTLDKDDTNGRMIEHDARSCHDANETNLHGTLDKWVSVTYTGTVTIGTCSNLENVTMKKFSFVVDVVADELDREVVVDSIRSCLTDTLPNDVHANVKTGEVKKFSEQGYKVWRARVTGVTAEQAGDAANPKSKKVEEAVA